jgi:hypothetical protein
VPHHPDDHIGRAIRSPSVASSAEHVAGRHTEQRIHRGEDITRHLSKTDRELTLPSMLTSGLVYTAPPGIRCSYEVATSLARPST